MTQETPRKKRPRDPAQLAKFVVDVATGEIEDREPTPEEQGKDPAAASMGKRGGKARASVLSPKERSNIASRAAQARWSKPKEPSNQK